MKGKRDTATQQGVLCDRQSSDQDKAVTKTPQKKGMLLTCKTCTVIVIVLGPSGLSDISHQTRNTGGLDVMWVA